MMDSYMVHRSARADQAGDGVGVVPGGFTPSGGGGVAIPRLATRLEENFSEVISK